MVRRGHYPGGQLRLDLLDQGTQVSLDARVFIQQVGETAFPPPRLRGTGSLQIRARRYELIVCFG
jgi:hypothetical protein